MISFGPTSTHEVTIEGSSRRGNSEPQVIYVPKEVPIEVVKQVEKEVYVEVPVEVEVEVPIKEEVLVPVEDTRKLNKANLKVLKQRKEILSLRSEINALRSMLEAPQPLPGKMFTRREGLALALYIIITQAVALVLLGLKLGG